MRGQVVFSPAGPAYTAGIDFGWVYTGSISCDCSLIVVIGQFVRKPPKSVR